MTHDLKAACALHSRAMNGERQSEADAKQRDPRCEDEFGRRTDSIFAVFGILMATGFLLMPFLYPKKELTLGLTVLQIALWAAYVAACIFLGALMDRTGKGFAFVYDPEAGKRRFGTKSEILVFLLLFVPAAYGYIGVSYLNTGYIGFNYITLFIVAAFSTLYFPLWLVGVFIVLEAFGWALLGKVLWGSWMQFDDIIGSLSGFAFAAMMFQLFKSERHSRHLAEALSRKLDTANERLRESGAQIEELSATRERYRIAREIHDTLGHSLTVVNMQLETALALLQMDKEKATVFVEKAQEMTRKGLGDIRASVAPLRASPLDGKTLEQGLKQLLDASRDSGIDFELHTEGESRKLAPQVEFVLYRTAQEGLTNVRKHSNAKRVVLALDYRNDSLVTLTLKDDGIGCKDVKDGFGLSGIRERVQLLNGETTIRTAPGEGLELVVSVAV